MKVRAYVDLDGVLARFTDGMFHAHGRPAQPVTTWNFHHSWGLTDEQFYAVATREFWTGLGRWEDGFALLETVERLVGRDRVCFLSSPTRTPGTGQGKREWFAKNLPAYDPWADLFLGGAKHKLAARDTILIDDSDANCAAFVRAGGMSWTPPRQWNHDAFRCLPDGTFDAAAECRAFEEFFRGLS